MRNGNKTKYIIIFFLLVVFIPLIVSALMRFTVFTWMTTNNDWIGFWGGYLGGICTLIAVIISINHSKKEMLSNQRLSVMPYLTIQEEKVMDESTPIVRMSSIEIPEEQVTDDECKYFFGSFTVKGIIKSIGMGHATNCRIESITVEKKRVKFPTGKQSIVVVGDETPFCIALLDFRLSEDDITEYSKKVYDEYFYGHLLIPEQASLKVNFEIRYEDVLGNKYRQKVKYIFPFRNESESCFDEEECYFEEISRPTCYDSINNSL